MIREIIKSFAESYSLDIWDWFSLAIALITLVVAVSTYISQKHTEKNTLPIINMKVQELHLNNLMTKLYAVQMRLVALRSLLEDCNYNSYLSEHLLSTMKIRTNIIHPELFYKELAHYREAQQLYSMVENYNAFIDVLISHLKDNNISPTTLQREFKEYIKYIGVITYRWDKIMSIIYNYNNNKLYEQFMYLFENHDYFLETRQSIIEEDKNNYFNKEDYCLIFINNDEDRVKVAQMINDSIKIDKQRISPYMIKKTGLNEQG